MMRPPITSLTSGAVAFLFAFSLPLYSAESEIPFGPPPAESSAPQPPTKASEEKVQILDDSTRSNGPVNLQRADEVDHFQLMLESARKLRDEKDLVRAERTLIQLLEGRAPEEIKRPALLDLALVMQEQKSYAKSQRLYSEYVRRYPKEADVPEVLLRQAYLYRDMGLPELAMSKFFAVMSACLNLKVEELDYYQKLVLRAQVEIAETYYTQGKFAEAAEYLNKVLKLESSELNRADVLYKLVRCYWNIQNFSLAAASARLHLSKFPDSYDAAETRFLLVDSLKKLGQDKEAQQELLLLLQKQQEHSKADAKQWLYWQQKAGNEIANQFYRQGDFLSALQVYQSLAALNDAPAWQFPVWYQVGLVHENLKQYAKATEAYQRILERYKAEENAELKKDSAVTTIVEMARWRKDFLAWEVKAQTANKQLELTAPDALKPAIPSS